jgi:hypothetical protein
MPINEAATRIKVFVIDGFGIWLAARHRNRSRIFWKGNPSTHTVAPDAEQPWELVYELHEKAPERHHRVSAGTKLSSSIASWRFYRRTA